MTQGIRALQDFTFTSKYAHYVDALGRRESWREATDRVFDMHLEKYGFSDYKMLNRHLWSDVDSKLYGAIEFARKEAIEMRAVGSQRALQFGGPPVLAHNARCYNCTVSYADRPRFFGEAMYLLLCGCGVGFSVQFHHVARLPQIQLPPADLASFHYTIPDSIEGWADSLNLLMASYFRVNYLTDDGLLYQPELYGRVVLDYSLIRLEGAPLRGGFKDRSIGLAPGPKPLRDALLKIRDLMTNLIKSSGQDKVTLRPIDVYDIVMHTSDAVLAGGVRRSATICVFSHNDREMITAKTGNWFETNPQRQNSNNSAMLLRNSTSYEEFAQIVESTKCFGDPGFIWVDNLEFLVNPCVEISMWPVWVTPEGEHISGWQFCNLSTINGARIKTKAEFLSAVRAAAITGTLQAGYTHFKYLGPVSELITEREALLGVSITGMMDNPDLFFDPAVQREGAQLVLDVNEEVAKLIGINTAARATCIKPSGNSSSALGSADGIHARHARQYLRTCRANLNEAPLKHMQKVNPLTVEESSYNPNGNGMVVRFPCVVDDNARFKADVTALEQLRLVQLTQKNWVAAGRRPDRCAQPWLTHNVSNTIHVQPDEWSAVSHYIYDNRHDFCGVTLIGAAGELDYSQAPYVEVWDEERIVSTWGAGTLFASGLIVDGLHAYGDLWKACSAALGEAPQQLEAPTFDVSDALNMPRDIAERVQQWGRRVDWTRRARKFADNYFQGNIREMTYCLKRVHYLKLWRDICREWKPVDFMEMTGDHGFNQMMMEPACGGLGCDAA